MKSFEIVIGKGRSPLRLDAAKLVEGRCLVQGASGSGKSYLARVIAEQTIPSGLQTVILDPEGEFSSLREKCDLLIAGPEGDVPTEVRSAKLLARRIAETGVSAVVDMSGLKLNVRREFVRIFLEALDGLPKRLEQPRLIVLDEAHIYAPESGKGAAVSKDAVVSLMSQGRKRGLAGVLLTQRLSKISKDATAEARNVFIGQTDPIDVKRAQDELGSTAESRSELVRLHPGTFYARGPALLTEEPLVVFQGRRAQTTHPEPGSRYQMKTPPPRKAITKILREFEALPPSKDAEDAATLADAHKRIRELERELRLVSRDGPGSAVDASEVRQLRSDRKALEIQLRKADKDVRAESERLLHTMERIVKEVTGASARIESLGNGIALVMPDQPSPMPSPTKRKAHAAINGTPTPGARSGLVRMLRALVQHDSLDKIMLAHLVGMSHKAGGFNNYISKGKVVGWWTVESGVLSITDAGVEEAGSVPPLPAGDDLVEYWCGKLPGSAREMLRIIVKSGDAGVDKSDLAAAVNMSPNGGGFNNYLSKMRKLKLISTRDPFVAADALRGG